MNKIIGYKFLTDEMKSFNGNEKWELDVWKEWNGELSLCNSGFHACRTPLQSLNYIYGNRWFVIEAVGEIIESIDDKFVCRRMRIIHELPIKEIMLRFAIACAKNSLFRFEQKFPKDNRPRKAIEVAEGILLGKISWSVESARSARSAAESAAWSARSARSAAESARSAVESARSAVESARSAAWSVESAESAAESAAWSVESAESAVESARSAAWSVESARSAELKWQNKILEKIIREY